MDDKGKILYELHCNNVKERIPEYAEYLISWNSLTDKSKECWCITATKFIEQVSLQK